MGTAAAVLGDKITATCCRAPDPQPGIRRAPTGTAVPVRAAITTQCEPTVLIGGKPAVVQGSWGLNVPPHVGLHPSDTFMAPPQQKGTVTQGSPTVSFGGKPAARTGSACTVCFGAPGQLAGTATTVLIA